MLLVNSGFRPRKVHSPSRLQVGVGLPVKAVGGIRLIDGPFLNTLVPVRRGSLGCGNRFGRVAPPDRLGLVREEPIGFLLGLFVFLLHLKHFVLLFGDLQLILFVVRRSLGCLPLFVGLLFGDFSALFVGVNLGELQLQPGIHQFHLRRNLAVQLIDVFFCGLRRFFRRPLVLLHLFGVLFLNFAHLVRTGRILVVLLLDFLESTKKVLHPLWQ